MRKRVLGVFEKSQKYDLKKMNLTFFKNRDLSDTKNHSQELSFWQIKDQSTLSAPQKYQEKVMIEISSNLRSKSVRPHIWAVGTHEQFPLHPNYSTSVKVRGPYYHSTSYLDCAGRANLGRRGPI